MGLIVGLTNWFRRKPDPEPELMPLIIKPGPWFQSYLAEWKEDHGIYHNEYCTSGIVTGEVTGDYIWVTATPEWDRDWFASRGFQFPAKWIEYKHMDKVVGEEGSSALMPGL